MVPGLLGPLRAQLQPQVSPHHPAQAGKERRPELQAQHAGRYHRALQLAEHCGEGGSRAQEAVPLTVNCAGLCCIRMGKAAAPLQLYTCAKCVCKTGQPYKSSARSCLDHHAAYTLSSALTNRCGSH